MNISQQWDYSVHVVQLTVAPQIELSGVHCLAEEGAIHVCLGKVMSIGLLLVEPNRGQLGEGAVATEGLVPK